MATPPEGKAFQPFVPDSETQAELTFLPILLGSLLGIIFGASSVYLVLKVGLTISASIPVAVLAITVFKVLGRTTILQNNIVQTTGSAGESIAFGVGLVMPALLILGFDIDAVRVMIVGVCGGLLGILMMIPLRRAFIVKKHGELKYPEGTACAEVLIAGEKGGSMAKLLFLGFGLGFVFQYAILAFKLFKDVTEFKLFATGAAGKTVGLKAGVIGCEMSAPLLGVGYIIGPRIASIMVAGGVLAYLVLVPAIAYFGENLTAPLAPAVSNIDPETGIDKGLIKNMDVKALRSKYILYIGAGAVAAGGIISMLQALPVIFGAVFSGLKDLSSKGQTTNSGAVPRTERDLPMTVVLGGSIGMVVAMMALPQLGLGFNFAGFAGALMILFFGFLFVTVSSRLTGEIGSSSNPISGMTVATLLLTCLLLVGLSELDLLSLGKETKLLALTIAGIVCVACSNGGTTSQALKTGHLLGATPVAQQWAILIGSLTSAIAVGGVLLALNIVGTIYSKNNLPQATVDVTRLKEKERVQVGQYENDTNKYFILNIGKNEKIDATLFKPAPGKALDVKPGRYLIDDAGKFTYLCDPAVNGELEVEDDGKAIPRFQAPKTQLVALIIDGIFDRNLPWDLVLIGVLIAITLELSGVPSLPFAVGVYLPLSSSMPIFLGGALRWLVDKFRKSATDDGDSSPGVLLGSGYIAGGSIAALLATLLGFSKSLEDAFDLGKHLKGVQIAGTEWVDSNFPVSALFLALAVVLFAYGLKKKA
jgi:putative OPT family oligopeptide transporter